MTLQNQTFSPSDATPSNKNLQGSDTTQPIGHSLANFLKRVAKAFWNHTDKMGKSNTSSYDGLL